MGKKRREMYGKPYYDGVTGATVYERSRFNYNADYQRSPPEHSHSADFHRDRGLYPQFPKRSNSDKFKWKRKRSPSPKAGTDKYMEKRIKQMSTNIMQHIMNPDQPNDLFNLNETSTGKKPPESTTVQSDPPATEPKKKKSKHQKSSTKKSHENQADVQEKIMTHLGNLREGKKKNIINVGSSNYDIAVQKIVQQRRLELSRVLRNMKSGNNQNMECMDLLNTIIPDMGISLEELPQQYIDELNRALQLEEFDNSFSFDQPDEQIEITSSEDAAILNVLDNIICKLNSTNSGITRGRSPIEAPIKDPESTTMDFEEHEVKVEPTEVSKNTDEIKVEPGIDEFQNLKENNPEIVVLSTNIKEEPEINELDDCILITDENAKKGTDTSEVKQEPVSEDCIILSDEDTEAIETEATVPPDIRLNDHVRVNIISETDSSVIRQCYSGDILHNRETVDVSVQTENSIIVELLEERFKETPNTLQEAVHQLLEIDKWVSTLAEYRQDVVMNLTRFEKKEKTKPYKKQKTKQKKDKNSIDLDWESEYSKEIEGKTSTSDDKEVEPIQTAPKTKNKSGKKARVQNATGGEGDTTTSHYEKAMESPSKPYGKPSKTTTTQNCDGIEAGTSHNASYIEPPSIPNDKPTETIQTSSSMKGIEDTINNVVKPKKRSKKATIQNRDGTEGNTSHNNEANKSELTPKISTKKKTIIKTSDNVEANTSQDGDAVKTPSKPNKPTKKAIIKTSAKCPREQGKEAININASLAKIESILVSENEVVTVVKSSREMLLVGTETGKVLIFTTKDGFLSHHLQFARQPIKSIFCNQSEKGTFIFVLNTTVEGCNLNCEALLEDITYPREARCMDCKWGYLFVGCTAGWFVRYSVQKNVCEYEDIFYGGTIGAIKALMEGVRRILLIVSLTYPVCIRDAMTGLPLRTFDRCYVDSPIDSIWVQDKYLYCGGKGVHVLVLSFNEGEIVKKIKVGGTMARKCFKTFNHLLLVSDFSSNISVFNTKTGKLVKTLEGPRIGIDCMEIVVDQVFTANHLVEFKTIPIPKELLKDNS